MAAHVLQLMQFSLAKVAVVVMTGNNDVVVVAVAVVVAVSGTVVVGAAVVVPHWHKPSTSQGHQDCPPKAHGAQWWSVAAYAFPGMAAHVLQLMQFSLAKVAVVVMTGNNDVVVVAVAVVVAVSGTVVVGATVVVPHPM